jgi:AcrR family transcriptional regulator
MTGSAPKPGARLTRELVLRTALRIIDEDGVDALSMRRLAADLNRDPMRLYTHADGKEALLDGVVGLVLQDFSVAKVLDGDWEQALRVTAHRMHRLALAHPHVVPLLATRGLGLAFTHRPLDSLQPVEDLLELFATAGFDDLAAVDACRMYTGFLMGQMLSAVQEMVDNPDETEAVLRFGLHRLPLRRFPRLRALSTALSEYDDAEALDRCLDTLLSGYRADLERQRVKQHPGEQSPDH